jgi:hypothetical protein
MSQFGSSQFGSAQYGAYETVRDAIEKTELIPVDAKQAIKDYLRETFNDLWNKLEDIFAIDPPIDLLENWDLLVDLVKTLLG